MTWRALSISPYFNWEREGDPRDALGQPARRRERESLMHQGHRPAPKGRAKQVETDKRLRVVQGEEEGVEERVEGRVEERVEEGVETRVDDREREREEERAEGRVEGRVEEEREEKREEERADSCSTNQTCSNFEGAGPALCC